MASYYLKGYTTPDGVNSRADVREWQNKLGVKADGIWGPNTQAAYERYANANSMSKFQEYYDTILGALNVPSISVSVPSKAELKEDISSYLRPGVDLAISKRRAAGETAKAELDADAVSSTSDYGLMQINKCNHDWLLKEGFDVTTYDGNIGAGIYMIGGYIETYGDIGLALMAYNCGPSGAQKLWSQGIYSTDYTRKVMDAYNCWCEVLEVAP